MITGPGCVCQPELNVGWSDDGTKWVRSLRSRTDVVSTSVVDVTVAIATPAAIAAPNTRIVRTIHFLEALLRTTPSFSPVAVLPFPSRRQGADRGVRDDSPPSPPAL